MNTQSSENSVFVQKKKKKEKQAFDEHIRSSLEPQ